MKRTLTFTVIFLSSLGLSFAQSARSAFDFMIERNSDMVTIPQGSGGINALHVTLLSGSPQDVALSAGGLPSGVTVGFQDNTVRFDREGGHPPFGSTYSMYINTSASTPLGTSTVTITGTSGATVRSVTFQLQMVPVTGNQIRYVALPASGGSDSNPGTSGSPWATLQHAANTVAAGNTVVVRAGTYFERLNIVTSGTNGSPITWIGETGAIIDGSRPAPTGWSPSGLASGVYEKSTGSMPFTPGAVIWNGKTGGWALELNPVDGFTPSVVISRTVWALPTECPGRYWVYRWSDNIPAIQQ